MCAIAAEFGAWAWAWAAGAKAAPMAANLDAPWLRRTVKHCYVLNKPCTLLFEILIAHWPPLCFCVTVRRQEQGAGFSKGPQLIPCGAFVAAPRSVRPCATACMVRALQGHEDWFPPQRRMHAKCMLQACRMHCRHNAPFRACTITFAHLTSLGAVKRMRNAGTAGRCWREPEHQCHCSCCETM